MFATALISIIYNSSLVISPTYSYICKGWFNGHNTRQMKTFKLFTSFILTFCSLYFANAQVNEINVNGLILGNIYSTQDVRIKLGWHPTVIVKSEEVDAEPNSYRIYIEEDIFDLSDFVLSYISLNSDRFWIGGPGRKIRVGDDISKLQPCLGGSFTDVTVNYNTKAIGFKNWRLADYPYEAYEVRFYYNEENKITEIYVAINPL